MLENLSGTERSTTRTLYTSRGTTSSCSLLYSSLKTREERMCSTHAAELIELALLEAERDVRDVQAALAVRARRRLVLRRARARARARERQRLHCVARTGASTRAHRRLHVAHCTRCCCGVALRSVHEARFIRCPNGMNMNALEQ